MLGPQIPWVGTFSYFYVTLKQRPVMNLAEDCRFLRGDVLTDLDKQNFFSVNCQYFLTYPF